jgi:hypothetical protein
VDLYKFKDCDFFTERGFLQMGNQSNNVLNWEDTFAKLAAPFSPDDVGWRLGHTFKSNDVLKGIAMPYATNRAIQKRLDETFGIFGWKNEYKEWLKGSQLCGISVRVTYEDGVTEWVTKWDGAECTDFEPIKGGLSDSMKRCAFQWSIGRYLYDIETQYVDVEEKGKTKTIGKKEKERLKSFLIGKSYTPSITEQQPKQQTSQVNQQNTDIKNNNTNKSETSNAAQNQPNTAIDNPSNTTSNAKNNTTAVNGNGNGNGNGNISVNKVSAKQAGFIKSLIQKGKLELADTLTKYGVATLEELSAVQASEAIKSLMALAS